ncbi:hypothetical protein HJC23_002714 [Cyclotella cryptica]|uniref:Uncharacterized protein n=1 Tax=Cyclotella cryptica TaxID=29204 RepID=A0ABD3PB34_9STRA
MYVIAMDDQDAFCALLWLYHRNQTVKCMDKLLVPLLYTRKNGANECGRPTQKQEEIVLYPPTTGIAYILHKIEIQRDFSFLFKQGLLFLLDQKLPDKANHWLFDKSPAEHREHKVNCRQNHQRIKPRDSSHQGLAKIHE